MTYLERLMHRSALPSISALLILLISAFGLRAQTFSIADGDQTTCTGTFVDDGGSGAPYSDNNYVITICPDDPTQVVSVLFEEFDLQTNANPQFNDVLVFYDGNSTLSPAVGAPSGNQFEGISITASENNPSGCLTFEFISSNAASGGNSGWVGEISCVQPCGTPISQSVLTSPSPVPNNPNAVGICPGDEVFVDGSGSVADGSPLSSWIWNWGDGQVETLSNAQAQHVYDDPGEYFITLYVQDENGCTSVNFNPIQVLVSPTPTFNTVMVPEVCVGTPTTIDGTGFQSGDWTAFQPPLVSEDEQLPDDLGIPFVSAMPVDFFGPDAEVTSCEDILSVTGTLHHTWIGDLTITLECPNGQSMLLLENGAMGGADPSGCMYPDLGGNNLGNPPTEAWDYTWTDDGDYIIDDPNNPAVTGGVAVPSGEYLPCGSFCDLIGCPLNGVWNFVVVDNWGGDSGYLEGWTLEFDPSLIPEVTTISPSIGIGLDSSYWDVSVGTNGVQSIDAVADVLDLLFTSPGVYDYTFEVVNSFGCDFDTTVSILVIDGPPNDIDAGPDVVFCGTPVVLQGENVTSGPTPCSNSQGIVTYCYDDNETFVETYCPNTPGDGTMMSMLLYAGEVENGWDYINVYDGVSNMDPLLQSFSGPFTESPIVATNPDGCLTVEFTSDGIFSCQTSPNYDPVSWCIGCGAGACSATYEWVPADNLDNPNQLQPTVLDFDGMPIEYTLYSNPIGYDNCAAVDAMMVVPAFTFEWGHQQPTCAGNDGVISVDITSPVADGPWDIELSGISGVLQTLVSNGGLTEFTSLTPGDYEISVASQSSGCQYDTEIELLTYIPPPLDVSPDDQICIGGTANLTVEADYGGPFVFDWQAGGTTVATGSSINVSPSVLTNYQVLGTDASGCTTELGQVTVGIYDGFSFALQAEELVCLGESVEVSAINVTGGQGNGYTFDFAYDGITFASGVDDQVSFVPPLTGEFCITVSEACSTPALTVCDEVEVEQPFDLTFEADTTRGCVPQSLQFTHSIPDAFVSTVSWDYGDGGQPVPDSYHVFNEPGVFDVGVTVITTNNCLNSAISDNYIQIFAPPSVTFTAGPQPTTAPDTRIEFDSEASANVVDWSWVFIPSDVEAVSSEEDPTFTFPMGNGGTYPVTLVVTDIEGCSSQVTRNVEIFDFFNVYIPSGFTPNNDGFNDLWTVYGSDIDPDRFELSIFNRWGERVFHTTDINQGWMGQSDDEVVDPTQQYFSGDGTYVYRVVFYSESTNEKREVRGYINLTR